MYWVGSYVGFNVETHILGHHLLAIQAVSREEAVGILTLRIQEEFKSEDGWQNQRMLVLKVSFFDSEEVVELVQGAINQLKESKGE